MQTYFTTTPAHLRVAPLMNGAAGKLKGWLLPIMRLEPAFQFIFSINAIRAMNVHARLSATSAFLTFHAFRSS